ncbi:ArsR/SmtB family transcription factor [Eubacteriales bacterium KG127]
MNKLPHVHNQKTEELLARMPDPKIFEMSTDLFSILSDNSRVKILWLLCHTEDCVANIAAAVNMSSPAVSHHLKLLKNAGILAYTKRGKEAYYTLADNEKALEVHKIIDTVFHMDCFTDLIK